jgi:hypothetical protein
MSLADYEIPYDYLPFATRNRIQGERFRYYCAWIWKHKHLWIDISKLKEDRDEGIDGVQRGISDAPGYGYGILQHKERIENRDAEYELRRDIYLPEHNPLHWGREWRNITTPIRWYDLTTPDPRNPKGVLYQRFNMPDLHRVALMANNYLTSIRLAEGRHKMIEALSLPNGESRMRSEGWELHGHQDATGGHYKSLLHIRWYALYGIAPPIVPLFCWRIT